MITSDWVVRIAVPGSVPCKYETLWYTNLKLGQYDWPPKVFSCSQLIILMLISTCLEVNSIADGGGIVILHKLYIAAWMDQFCGSLIVDHGRVRQIQYCTQWLGSQALHLNLIVVFYLLLITLSAFYFCLLRTHSAPLPYWHPAFFSG